MPQKGSTAPLPQLRQLTDPEIELLRQAPKVIVDDIAWRDVAPGSRAGRRWETRVDVYALNPGSLPFDVQSNMELVVAVIRGGEQDFYYRVVATRQIIRMYHNAPGHLEDGTFTPGQHKHKFTEDLKRGGYVPNPLLPAKLRDAVLGFLVRKRLSSGANMFRSRYPRQLKPSRGKLSHEL